MNVKRLSRSLILWIALAIVLAVFGFSSLNQPKVSSIDTSDGMALIAAGKVDQAKITEGVQRVNLTLAEDFTKDDKNFGKLVQFNYVVPQGESVVNAIAEAEPEGRLHVRRAAEPVVAQRPDVPRSR